MKIFLPGLNYLNNPSIQHKKDQDVDARQLSHQDVTGVGYGICVFHPAGVDESRHFLDLYRSESKPNSNNAFASSDPYRIL